MIVFLILVRLIEQQGKTPPDNNDEEYNSP
jgi:hypothetical protein